PTPCRSHPLAATSRPHPSDTRLETPPDERREAEGMPTDREATIRELARAHGLDISGTVTVNELGLDFQVAIAEAADGLSWVLRVPRRPNAAHRAAAKARSLSPLPPHLSLAVRDWQIHPAELTASPPLPGDPGLTIDERGGPRWHFDVESPEYAASLGNFLAALHTVDPALVRDSGIPEHSPAEGRQHKREDIDRAASASEVAPELCRRGPQWLADASAGPTFP